MTSRGRLIAFEGIDGAGKSSQLTVLHEWLTSKGHEVLRTFEPTNQGAGRVIRDHARAGRRLEPEEELKLFLKDRRRHVQQTLEPALAAGKIVLIDRYYPSTIAYQGARGLNPADLQAQNEAFAPPPDLMLLFDIDAKTSLARVSNRGEADAFEELESLRRARSIFLAIKHLNRVVIDATQSLETISEEVRRAVLALLRDN